MPDHIGDVRDQDRELAGVEAAQQDGDFDSRTTRLGGLEGNWGNGHSCQFGTRGRGRVQEKPVPVTARARGEKVDTNPVLSRAERGPEKLWVGEPDRPAFITGCPARGRGHGHRVEEAANVWLPGIPGGDPPPPGFISARGN